MRPVQVPVGRDRMTDQDDAHGAARPPLDPEEHAGRKLTPEEHQRRAELLARNKDANQRARGY